MKNKHFGIATALAVLFTATYFLGKEIISVSWENHSIGWVEIQPASFQVVGLQAGKSTFADAMQRLAGAQLFLQRTGDGFNIELEAYQADGDNQTLTVLVQPDSSVAQQEALYLQAKTSGLFADGSLDAERVPFTTLTDPGFTSLPVRKIEIVPAIPMAHDRVLAAHGKPDLSSPVQNHDDGAEQAWVYPRKGAVIFFREKEAIRFRYFDPAVLRSPGNDAPVGVEEAGAML